MQNITIYKIMLCFVCVNSNPYTESEDRETSDSFAYRLEDKMKELDYKKMGMRIRQVRRAKGWSQDELAKKCDISMSFLGHIERGTRIMSLDTLVHICAALDTGADELLWGVASPSEALLELWSLSDKKTEKKADTDSYSMYIQIMKSVAEIMNEA